jgi:UDP-glucose 4-epimerase
VSAILITGSSGFVGKALVDVFRESTFEIIKAENSDNLDLCSSNAVNGLPPVDIIIHLAARSFVPDSFVDPYRFYHNNIVSTLNILEKAKRDKARVIFFSTYVYGRPSYLPIDENHPKNPLNPYTQSKVIGEELCEAYHRDFNVPVTIFRPFNIYGPGQSDSFIIPTIIKQLCNPIIHLNDARPKRDFIYIEDVVNAVRLSIEKGDDTFHIFNLGSGVSRSVEETVGLIRNISGSESEIIFSNSKRQGEILDTVADISKIREVLDWKPKYSLEQGLAKILQHY